MKVLLDVKDEKAGFILELLRNFKFVKTKELTPTKAEMLNDLQEAAEQVRFHKQGKIKLKTAKELLDEL
jgi:hypothetical protein